LRIFTGFPFSHSQHTGKFSHTRSEKVHKTRGKLGGNRDENLRKTRFNSIAVRVKIFHPVKEKKFGSAARKEKRRKKQQRQQQQ